MQREIKITVTAPCDCTEEEFKEWVTNQLNEDYFDNKNPLKGFGLNPDKIEFLNYPHQTEVTTLI